MKRFNIQPETCYILKGCSRAAIQTGFCLVFRGCAYLQKVFPFYSYSFSSFFVVINPTIITNADNMITCMIRDLLANVVC